MSQVTPEGIILTCYFIIIYVVKCMKIMIYCKRALINCHRHRYAPILIKCRWKYMIFFSVNSTKTPNNCKQTCLITSSCMLLFWIIIPAHMRKCTLNVNRLWMRIGKSPLFICNIFYRILFYVLSHADKIWVWLSTSQKMALKRHIYTFIH